MRRRMECNQHGQTLRYRCADPDCPQPLLCSHPDCLDSHFHSPTLSITRFDHALWEGRLVEVQHALLNDALTRKQASLDSVIQHLTSSMARISEEMTGLDRIKQEISQDSPAEPVTAGYLNNLNGFLCLSSQLDRKLDALRAKINEEEVPVEEYESAPIPSVHVLPPQPTQKAEAHPEMIASEIDGKSTAVSKNDVSWEKPHMTALLEKQIPGFSWEGSEIVWDSTSGSTTCERFHEKLRGRGRLLFIFVGENGMLLGSYYEAEYPSTAQKGQHDPNSFIFVEDDELPNQMALFKADPQEQSHITVSERLLICHGNTPNYGDGLRTFQRTFESLAYFLPSKSFRPAEGESALTPYNGMMKTKEFAILQLREPLE